MFDPGSGDPRTRGDPPVVALKCHAKPVIVDPQIAVATAHDRLRHDLLHLLRHHSHIGLVTAVVGEAIEAQAVVEASEQGDVVFEPDVGPPSATSSTSASRAGAACKASASRATAATKARAAARGVAVGHSTGLHVAKRAIATRPGSAAADPTTRWVADVRTVSRRGAAAEIGSVSKPPTPYIGAATAAEIGALAAKIGPPAAGPQHLL